MDVLHDEEVAAVVVAADLVDLRDVLVMKRADEPRLVEEHRDERFVVIGDR